MTEFEQPAEDPIRHDAQHAEQQPAATDGDLVRTKDLPTPRAAAGSGTRNELDRSGDETVRVRRLDVVVDAQTHDSSLD